MRYAEWTQLAEDRVQWCSVVSGAVEFVISLKANLFVSDYQLLKEEFSLESFNNFGFWNQPESTLSRCF
jgi:hypothetical protein